MSGLMDFRALSPGMDYGQMIASFGAGQQVKAQRAQADLQQRQLVRQDQADVAAMEADRRRTLAGGQYASGDTAGARNTALESGDFDLAATFAKMDETTQAGVKRKADAAAPIFAAALEVPLEQRAAFINNAFPALQGAGFTPEELAQIQPSDDFLKSKVAATMTIDGVVRKQQADRTFAETRRHNAEQEALAAQGQAITMRGQNMTDTRQREGNTIAARGAGLGRPPSGYRYTENGDLQAIPGGPALKDKALTEGQAKGTGLYRAASEAAKVMNTVKIVDLSLVTQALDSGNVTATGLGQNERRVLNAQRAFANATLRLESGAAISVGEINEKARVLFPAPGDGPDVLRDKASLRSASLAALRDASGPGADALPRVTAQSSRQTVRITGQADFDKLKSGTVFVGPDGIRRTKQ